MNFIPWLLLLVVVMLGTVGQLSLKYALNQTSSTQEIAKAPAPVWSSRYFWLWFFCYVVVTILWLFVLRNIPLNKAFPALGLTFAFVPLASQYFLAEKVAFKQWFGIALIISGVVLVVQK
jgi:undecaprenyl phosphate-alpha-L-ara4N flippase subunit ArnE